MSLIVDFFSKIYQRLKGHEENEVVEHENVITIPTVSVKRRPDENSYEEILVKRKKLFSPVSTKNNNDLSLSSYLLKNSLSEFQKENQRMVSDNMKMNEILRKQQKSPRVKQPEVYCIDDGDANLQGKRNDVIPRKGMNFEKVNSGDKSSDSDDCVVINDTHQSFSQSNSISNPMLCLNKVQNMQEQNKLLIMMKNQFTQSRRSIPLTNSTIHNTKQNRTVSSDSFNNRNCSFRNYLMCSAKMKSPSLVSKSSESLSPVKPAESFFDKVVIDLTGSEDDEDQRQTIESKVLSSSEIKNMKSSFVAEETFALDDDLISSVTRKYDTKIEKMKTRASKFEKAIHDRRDEFAKTISEILEKRLSLKEHVQETEDPSQKPSMELAPITKEMISEINGILASRKCPLIQIKDTSVKIQDIRTLENPAWLNDEVINAYMNLIKQRCEENPKAYPKVHCFNTFLYEQLNKKGYSSVRRWTRKVDIFDFEILIIPIHLGNHWCLVQIRFSDQLIIYYDSMGSPNNRCLNTMLQYLGEEYQDKKKGSFDTSGWRLISVPPDELPQQTNAHDCGVFACTFAEHITRNAPFNFDQDHMRYFRVKMMYEILTGSLLL